MSTNSRVPVLLVPGLAVSAASYHPIIQRLSQTREVRPVSPPRGFPADVNWELFESLVDEAAGSLQKFSLLGHSLGGAVALRYAAMYPERVHKVVAVGPVMFPFKRVRRRFPNFLFRNVIMSLQSRRFIHPFRVFRDTRQQNGGGRLRRIRIWAGRIDLTDCLPKLQHALIVWMSKEELIPSWQFAKLTGFANVRTDVWPGYHNQIIIAPDELCDQLVKELDG